MPKKQRTVSRQQQQILDEMHNELPAGRVREEVLQYVRRGFLAQNALRRLKRGYKKLKREYKPGVAYEGKNMFATQDVDRLFQDG